jgi:hypothetical protein
MGAFITDSDTVTGCGKFWGLKRSSRLVLVRRIKMIRMRPMERLERRRFMWK